MEFIIVDHFDLKRYSTMKNSNSHHKVFHKKNATSLCFSAKESKIHMEELTKQISEFTIVQGMLLNFVKN